MPLARASSTLKRTCILMFCCDWSLPENDEFLNKRFRQFWVIIGNVVLQLCKLLQQSHYLCWNEVSSQTGDCGAYRPCLLLTEVIVSIRNPRCLNTDLSKTPTFYHSRLHHIYRFLKYFYLPLWAIVLLGSKVYFGVCGISCIWENSELAVKC